MDSVVNNDNDMDTNIIQSFVQPASKPPSPPRLKASGLPEAELSPLITPSIIGDDTEISDLTPSQLYEMNQNLYDDSIPNRPLIDQIVPMSVLRAEYENGSASFVQQIDWLTNNGFDSIRRTRGDGDCFYRFVPSHSLCLRRTSSIRTRTRNGSSYLYIDARIHCAHARTGWISKNGLRGLL